MIRVILLAVLAGCPGTPARTTPTTADDTALRIRIAQLEARRADGLADLAELAAAGDRPTRMLAARALGRIGGGKALGVLTGALQDPEPEVVDAAAAAIGLATSLDEDTAGRPAITHALYDAQARHRDSEAIVEAIGRAADTTAQGELARGVRGGAPAIAAASAYALGRFGRRKLELAPATRSELVAGTRHRDPRVRLAAAYALAREHLVKPDELRPYLTDSGTALAALLGDADATIRAQAAQALARRQTVVAHADALATAADDPDWRVAVEAIRALAGDAGDDRTRVAAALAALRWTVGLPGAVQPAAADGLVQEAFRRRRTRGPEGAHVVIEALRTLAPHTKLPAIRELVVRIGAHARGPVLTRAWIECLARAGTIRGAEAPNLDELSTCGLPDHLRLPLIAGLVTAKIGSLDARRAALAPLLAHADPRVRVAGMPALASLWSEGSGADHDAVVAMTIAALGHRDGLVAGTAIETASTLYEAIDKDRANELRERLDAALLARAQSERDPELATSLFGLIGERKLAAGAPACRGGLRGAPVLARAAAKCLEALGEAGELEPAIGAATPPPVEVATVIGKQVRWRLATTRGEIVIELRPDVAPWAVAAIADLTRKQFYDGLEIHRVVPDFVAQGGDPTQSGWGGPGFTLPAEPSTGAGYVEGGVGMADAGRDSAGSQWFVMHGPAPHLDGRYTWVGKVTSGQTAANSLQIGDVVQRATIELDDRP